METVHKQFEDIIFARFEILKYYKSEVTSRKDTNR